MEHFRGNTKFVDSCRDVGFIELDWQYKTTNNISGQIEDVAVIRGNQFAIYVSITHKLLSKHISYQDEANSSFKVSISFELATYLGGIQYFSPYSDTNYDRAKEYAEWQATLIFRMLSHLEKTNFLQFRQNDES
jgi:hypothetical protein